MTNTQDQKCVSLYLSLCLHQLMIMRDGHLRTATQSQAAFLSSRTLSRSVGTRQRGLHTVRTACADQLEQVAHAYKGIEQVCLSTLILVSRGFLFSLLALSPDRLAQQGRAITLEQDREDGIPFSQHAQTS